MYTQDAGYICPIKNGIAMEKCPVFFMALLAALACSRLESDDPYASLGLTYGKNLSHDEICLGGKLENPYKTINIQ